MHIASIYRLLLIVILILVTSSCSTGSGELPEPGWQRAGLSDVSIHTIQAKGEMLFTGTNQGIFRKSISPSGQQWQHIGLDIDSAKVVDFIFRNNGGILAAVKYDEVRTNKPTLFNKQRNESTWSPIHVNKPDVLDFFVVRFLEKVPNSSKDIVSYVGRIVKSIDGGNNWKIIFEEGGISEFLTIDKHHPDQIWTGGYTNIFSPYLAKSEDSGDSWTLLNNEVSTGSDATIHDAILNPENPDKVLVAMGELRQSNNGGQSWQTISTAPFFITVMVHSVGNQGTIYASGQNTDSTPFFIQSDDFGESWQIIEMPESPTGIRVNDLAAVEVDGREVLYLGTNGGVYNYTFVE